METCGGEHHIGSSVLIMVMRPARCPHYVRPYAKVHESDDQDAEASRYPTMPFVRLKIADQRNRPVWAAATIGLVSTGRQFQGGSSSSASIL